MTDQVILGIRQPQQAFAIGGGQARTAGHAAADDSPVPLGIEIALITESVAEAHDKAVSVGATSIREPLVKPWGQTVSYVRCPDGTLVESCAPMGN